MVAIIKSGEKTINANLVNGMGNISILRPNNPNTLITTWKKKKPIYWDKYQIKETDMRVKTATFTSPNKIDLTDGQYRVLITCKGHENFGGIIISDEYDEDTGLYNYQCQDFSRLYQSKFNLMAKNVKIYNLVRYLITQGGIPYNKKATKKQLKKYKKILSGLRPAHQYEQKYYGSTIKFNPMTQKISVKIKDKSWIQALRDVLYGTGAYIDIYFDIYGVLHVAPYHKKDLFNSGLHIAPREIASRKFKFDTTNIITGVVYEYNGKFGNYSSSQLVGMDLTAFFGNIKDSVTSNTETKKKTNDKKSNNTVSTKDNPYGNKKKKIWIGADGGSGGFTQEICRLLEKAGWYVHYSGEGANVHYNDYFNVTSDYQILAIVDNGVCCTTIKEAYESSDCAPELKRKGVIPMFMFDSRDWHDPKKRGPNRYGNFKGTVVHTAYDDPSGYCQVMKVDEFFRKHKAVYCASPTAKGMVDMFLKGGYYASKGIKV